uniref:Uncharacterized protein n=1 Tax=Candidatus Kentrum sp. LPFa TaxID=2126335 RepID=A0A450X243_9GAMM|nr:MAG: hypothetical protein BECKLPF1236A_GA0070988_100045 [Candidatus Kentron sp. LPFa]VFK23374.1 MAG: hypothetical protein BECKLPF1236C_GA0070990_1000510 [Candidatus Kentron sp. LPFa]
MGPSGATEQPTQAIRPLSPLTFRVIGLASQFIRLACWMARFALRKTRQVFPEIRQASRLMGLAFRMAGKASGTASLASRLAGDSRFLPILPFHTTTFTSFPGTTMTFLTGFPSMNRCTFSLASAACSISSRVASAATVT